MWRRLDATLVYDSRDRAAVGVRAVTPGFPRLVYSARGFEVDLQIRNSVTAGRARLMGQVLDEEFEPCAGRVSVEGRDGVVTTSLDPCGHFSIDGLLPGRHQIEVSLSEALIVVPPFHL
jgi:hypothetical protein